jgi:hypothetical protein
MRTTYNDGILNTNDPWFLAKITAVCPPDVETYGECAGYTCSWEQYVICDNMQKLTDTPLNMVTGDCTIQQNIAVPINQEDPSALVGSVVLMRQRGTYEQEYNIYEFVTTGGALPAGDNSCFVVKSVQCTNNILQVVSSNAGGCINCTGGLASYTYAPAVEIPTNTPYLLPNNWTLAYGDLTTTGLAFSGDELENTSGSTLTLRITYQAYFTPQGVGATQSRWIFIAKNGSTSDLPVASFVSSNQTYVATVATNVITLLAGDKIQAGAFQDGGNNQLVGGNEQVPTTLTIERLCL